MQLDELKATLRRLKRARKKLDAIQAEYDALKDICKDHMIEAGVEELTVDGFQLRYKLVVSSAVDTRALKAAMPELCERFTRTSEARRFTITVPV